MQLCEHAKYQSAWSWLLLVLLDSPDDAVLNCTASLERGIKSLKACKSYRAVLCATKSHQQCLSANTPAI